MMSFSKHIDEQACLLEDVFQQPLQRKQIIDDLLYALEHAEPDDWDRDRRARFRHLKHTLSLLKHHTNQFHT